LVFILLLHKTKNKLDGTKKKQENNLNR